jgi:hypothetical protein
MHSVDPWEVEKHIGCRISHCTINSNILYGNQQAGRLKLGRHGPNAISDYSEFKIIVETSMKTDINKTV